MNLSDLTSFAVKNNHAQGSSTPSYELPIGEARARVKIKDGNRKLKLDGSQSLTLSLGKIVMSLDAIKPGSTRINATKEQVTQFTAVLRENIDSGAFDDAIVAAQAKARASAESRGEASPSLAVVPEATQEDMDALDNALAG